ncbi:P13 family porin [Borreliella lusitaniae]|uniref:P13 family porin n=1 Tax=Borreliella lusitaniae TaxID=100177 RepID=A0ABZ0CGH5_9SPIR|nr:P13 family porin [Borreliella lusitaniae]WKC84989.1 P13 family porin [Borreliella lusitaniae]WNY66428.1 P13 family porin [Borreliella lusitaniae]WNY68277.1 P13 family porin [Borreliella lusitaniae]
MHKFLIFILVAFCAFSSFAQVDDSKSALNLGAGEKFLAYEVNKKEALIPFLLNLFLGFGIGSFAQGDILGGSLILGFDAIGIGLILTGAYLDIKDFDKNAEKVAFSWTWGKGMMLAGAITMAVTRLTEIVLPFTFANSYNKKLKNSLNIALAGFEPSFDVNMGQASALGFELSFKKSY